jgi:hypothetical protein
VVGYVDEASKEYQSEAVHNLQLPLLQMERRASSDPDQISEYKGRDKGPYAS